MHNVKLNKEKLFNIINDYMERENLSKSRLAKELGIDRGTLDSLLGKEEKGKGPNFFKPDTVVKISNFFNIPCEELLAEKSDYVPFHCWLLEQCIQNSKERELKALLQLLHPFVEEKKASIIEGPGAQGASGEQLLKTLNGASKPDQFYMKLFLYLLTDQTGNISDYARMKIRKMDQRESRKALRVLYNCLEQVDKIFAEQRSGVLVIDYEKTGDDTYHVCLSDIRELPIFQEYQIDGMMEFDNIELSEKDGEDWEEAMRAALQEAVENRIYESSFEDMELEDTLFNQLLEYVHTAIFLEWDGGENDISSECQNEETAGKKQYDPFSRENIARTSTITAYLRSEMEHAGNGKEFFAALQDGERMDAACKKYGVRNPFTLQKSLR